MTIRWMILLNLFFYLYSVTWDWDVSHRMWNQKSVTLSLHLWAWWIWSDRSIQRVPKKMSMPDHATFEPSFSQLLIVYLLKSWLVFILSKSVKRIRSYDYFVRQLQDLLKVTQELVERLKQHLPTALDQFQPDYIMMWSACTNWTVWVFFACSQLANWLLGRNLPMSTVFYGTGIPWNLWYRNVWPCRPACRTKMVITPDPLDRFWWTKDLSTFEKISH